MARTSADNLKEANWKRQSAGVWKNTVTGEVLKGQEGNPVTRGKYSKGYEPAPATPVGDSFAPNAAVAQVQDPKTTAAVDAEWLRLRRQFNRGDITKEEEQRQLRDFITKAQNPQTNKDLKLETPADVIQNTFDASRQQTGAGNILTNPNQQTDFGSQTVSIDPVTGQPLVKQELSGANKEVLGGIQGGATSANALLQQLLSGQGALSSLTGQAGSAPSAHEDALFQQLTRDLEPRQQRETEELSQVLANRGIPVGSELYNNQMAELKKGYDDQYSNARNQAVTGSFNQGLASAGQLSGIGQGGLYNPSFQGFQSTDYQQADIQGLFKQLQDYNLGQQTLQTNKDIAAGNNQTTRDVAAKTIAANNAAAASPSPFNPTAPPGQ